jgi:hypothetical protein
MVTHRIRSNEPVFVLVEQTLDEDGDLTDIGEVSVESIVPGFEDVATSECTCGEHFGSDVAAAEKHLQEIAESDNGEAVTHPVTLQEPAVSVDVEYEQKYGSSIKLDWEMPVETAMRVFIFAHQCNYKCSNRLAWSAFYAAHQAFLYNDERVEFTVYYADRGWRTYLTKILNEAVRCYEGDAQAHFQALAKALASDAQEHTTDTSEASA